MTATKNVRQLPQSHKSSAELIVPRHGVVTLFGYAIQVRVDRGHLVLLDGIGPDRRYARLSRVGHGLKRLVVIGSDGMISLAALRWLSDQDVAFTMLERDGKVLAVTGPVRPSDVKLRRSQALANSNGAALRISRELISQKTRCPGTSRPIQAARFQNCRHYRSIQGGIADRRQHHDDPTHRVAGSTRVLGSF